MNTIIKKDDWEQPVVGGVVAIRQYKIASQKPISHVTILMQNGFMLGQALGVSWSLDLDRKTLVVFDGRHPSRVPSSLCAADVHVTVSYD